MKSAESSPEWSASEVLARLRAGAEQGQPVSVQVFLHDDVPAKGLQQTAKKIVDAAKKKVGKHASAELHKVHQLAKSFSLKADLDTLTAVAGAPGVKTILPSDIPDILPKPRDVGSA